MSQPASTMEVVIVAGMSGAGKTVALKALEDCGYYPLDHLPADVLPAALQSVQRKGEDKVAVGLDIWDPSFLPVARDWKQDFPAGSSVKVLLLEASNETLERRYGETRRAHPLARNGLGLPQAIAKERALFDVHSRGRHRIDTTGMSPNTLKAAVKSFLGLANSHMDICVESFGFKHGAPTTCDLIFDVRCLPNPYYDKSLRPMSGLDQPVRDFFERHERPAQMAAQIARFVADWKPDYERDHRSYLSVGVGCTGGQHRSVYVAELARAMLEEMGIHARCRHREQARWASAHAPEPAAAPRPPAP